MEEEVGDLFFVLVNIARYLSLDPESALRKTNRKFKQRFQWMEEQLRASGRGPDQASMTELESLWQQAKLQLRTETSAGIGTSARPDDGSTTVIRNCHGLDELSACVSLQKEVWNFTDAELVPLRMFVVAEKIGGQVIGAFDDGKLVAFALSLPGSRGGHCLSSFADAGRAERIPQRRPGTSNQTVSAERRSGPRIRIDGVDI